MDPLVHDAHAVFAQMGVRHEIIVVNDGSTDATGQILADMEAVGLLRVVTYPHNRGLGGAIKSAVVAALESSICDDDIIINMDADNTHDPAYIPGMVAKIWNDGYDVVIASRFCTGSKEVGVPFFRLVLSRGARILFSIFLRLPEVRDYTCGYRAYRASVMRAATVRYGDGLITRQGFACTDELLLRVSTMTKRITEVPFVLRYDKKRSPSKLPLFKTIYETLRMLLFHR